MPRAKSHFVYYEYTHPYNSVTTKSSTEKYATKHLHSVPVPAKVRRNLILELVRKVGNYEQTANIPGPNRVSDVQINAGANEEIFTKRT